METTLKRPERNLGIEALRIVSMLLIAAVHVYNRGGVAGKLHGLAIDLNYPMRVLCMAAVNLYALISGYVMVKGRFRPARFLELWLQVVCIGLTECLICTLVSPGAVGWENWRTALLPVTQYEYWYFTAYAAVFLLSPLINRGLLALTQRQLRALMAGIFCLFSLGWLLGKMYYGDSFHLGGGYSAFWLLLIYVLGGGLRLTGFLDGTPAWKLGIGALVSIAALYGLKNLFGIPTMPEQVQDWGKLILSYCNPLIVTLSVCVFVLFTRLRLRGPAADVVQRLAPLSFGVYLIHVHPAAWSWLEQRFAPLASLPAWLTLPAVLAAAAGIFLVCALLDWLRSLLFRLLRVRKLCDRVEKRITLLWR